LIVIWIHHVVHIILFVYSLRNRVLSLCGQFLVCLKLIRFFLFGLFEGHLSVVLFVSVCFLFCFFHIFSHSNLQIFYTWFLISVYVCICIFTWFVCAICLDALSAVSVPWMLVSPGNHIYALKNHHIWIYYECTKMCKYWKKLNMCYRQNMKFNNIHKKKEKMHSFFCIYNVPMITYAMNNPQYPLFL